MSTIPCRLFAAVYSIYSQLPFISGGLLHAMVTRDGLNRIVSTILGTELNEVIDVWEISTFNLFFFEVSNTL
jgi:hypothetical protein